MATSGYLYHALGLYDYKPKSTEYIGGVIYHHVRCKRDKRRCRYCSAKGRELKLLRPFERPFYAQPVGTKQQIVVLHGYRQHCTRCGRQGRERIPFALGQAQYTRGFASYVLQLRQFMTLLAVATLLSVSWGRIKGIHKSALQKRRRSRRLKDVRYIAVDEFAIRRGHHYMTVVLDLEANQVLYVQEGKDAEALRTFLLRLRRARAPLQAVAMDLSAAYHKALRSVYGPRVAIVNDPYHLVALANEAVDETRRAIVRALSGDEARAVKDTRFLLLRGRERLRRKQEDELQRLSEINAPLFNAYLLKEQLRQLWSIGTRADAASYLDAWIFLAQTSGCKPFERLAETFKRHREGILAYFNHPITSGPIEGLNNRIKTLKRQAYGFRDMPYFKLLILHLHDPLVQV